MKRSSWPWLLAGGVALAALVYFLADRFPGALSSEGSGFRVIYLVALLALVGSGLLHRRLGLTKVVGSAAVWIALALLLVLGYSYRAELTGLKDRVMGELLPHGGTAAGGGALAFRPAMDGISTSRRESMACPYASSSIRARAGWSSRRPTRGASGSSLSTSTIP